MPRTPEAIQGPMMGRRRFIRRAVETALLTKVPILQPPPTPEPDPPTQREIDNARTIAETEEIRARTARTNAETEEILRDTQRADRVALLEEEERRVRIDTARRDGARDDSFISTAQRLSAPVAVVAAAIGATVFLRRGINVRRETNRVKEKELFIVEGQNRTNQEAAKFQEQDALEASFAKLQANINSDDPDTRITAEVELSRFAFRDRRIFHERMFQLIARKLQTPYDASDPATCASKQTLLSAMLTIAPDLLIDARTKKKDEMQALPYSEGIDQVNSSPILKAPGIILDGLTVEDNFAGIDMENASMRRGKFNGSLFRDNDLKEADATGASFEGTSFTNVSAQGMRMDGANFEGAIFYNVIILDIDLSQASFTGAHFTFPPECATQEQIKVLKEKGATVKILSG